MYWNDLIVVISPCMVEINYNMRCIETLGSDYAAVQYLDKLQHEMYWNDATATPENVIFVDKLQHEMYWNMFFKSDSV